MAYKRKFNGKSNRRTRRRKMVRRPRIRRTLMSNNIHRFKRVCEIPGAIIASPTAPVYGSIQFTMGLLPNVSEFTSLYDMYRINKIKVTWVPTATGLDLNAQTGAYYMPNFHSVVDYDDATAPSNVTDLMQYPNYKRTIAVKQHSRYFTPAIASEIYRSSVTTSYSTQYKQWVDWAQTDVPHYGVKYCLDLGNPAGGNQVAFRQYVTFYFDCKGVR